MSEGLYTESFVLYESVFRLYERLYKKDKAKAADYINAVMEFGLYGVIPNDEDDVWLYGLDGAIASISAAKSRRTKNIEDGGKGGRKKIDLDIETIKNMRQCGYTLKQIAAEFGVSEKTISRRLEALADAKDKMDKTQNLNVNVTENENENEKGELPMGKLVLIKNEKVKSIKERAEETWRAEKEEQARREKEAMHINPFYGVDMEAFNNAKSIEEQRRIMGF